MTYPKDDLDDLPLLAADEPFDKEHQLDNSVVPSWSISAIQSSRQYRNLFIASIASCFTTILLMLGVFTLTNRLFLSRPILWESAIDSHRPGTVWCGATTEEAISHDCIFDELSMMWMPRKCTQSYNDQYMVANNGGPFLYWVDRHGKQLIDDPSHHAGGGSIFWTSRRNHIVHCQYNLYRLADALRSGEYIGHDDGQSLTDHMHHCIRTMTEFALKAPAHEIDVNDVITEAGFGYC